MNLTQTALAPLTLRLALAFFFVFQGMSKLGPDNSWGSRWHGTLSPAVQVPIAWGEFFGGVTLLFGFLTRITALAMGGVLIASVLAVHGREGFDIRNHGLGFEYTVCLAVVCVALALLGGGPVGLDALLWKKKRPGERGVATLRPAPPGR
jgi:putative oxidoreductase